MYTPSVSQELKNVKIIFVSFTDSKQTRSKNSTTDTTKKYPASAKQKITEKPSGEVKESRRRSQSKKESSYDASGSDSDENVLSGKLSPKDDIGYETGSFDDIDASSSDTTSPAAADENKSILSKPTDDPPAYTYADLEFRPLIVTDEGGFSAPVNTTKDRLSYDYAGNEFRPLIVTENGGVAGPVEAQSNDLRVRPQPTSYEEVEIQSGNFDRANVNLAQLMPSSGFETLNYSQENDARTEHKQTLDDGLSENVGDVYATVNKDRQRTPKEPELPPEIPSRKEITRSDLYEHITGELKNMIDACDEETSSTTPPPLPRPYSGSGVVRTETDNISENVNSIEGIKMATFLTVNRIIMDIVVVVLI